MKTLDEFKVSIEEAFLPLDVVCYFMKKTVLKVVDAYCKNPDAKEYVIEILQSDSKRISSDPDDLVLFISILIKIGIPIKKVSMEGTILKIVMEVEGPGKLLKVLRKGERSRYNYDGNIGKSQSHPS